MAAKKDIVTENETEAFPGDTALATLDQSSREVSTEVVSFEETGGEQFEMDDVSIPFINVLQALSPQCSKQDPAFIQGAEEGMILNTATGEIWDGAKGCPVIVVSHSRRYTEWWPRNSKKGKGLVTDFGTDKDAAMAKVLNPRDYPWETKDETVIVEAGTYYVLALSPSGGTARGIINLQGTQLKKYKQLNTMMSSLKFPRKNGGGFYNPPIFCRVYLMQTVPESNDQGRWYGVKFTPGPVLGPSGIEELDARILNGGASLFREALEFRQQILAGDVRAADAGTIDQAPAEGEEAPF